MGWSSSKTSSGGSGGGSVNSVTGLNTDNTDPTNPEVKISVDNTTINGAGTPVSPLSLVTPPNPTLLGFSGILGTNTVATNLTIAHSIYIRANTLTTNNILQIVFRMARVSGNNGQVFGRIYFNTQDDLLGATLFNTTFTMNGGSTQFTGLVERNFGFDGSTLRSYSNTAFSEYTTGNFQDVLLNPNVDNYILLTMQVQNFSDVANINLFKVFSYA